MKLSWSHKLFFQANRLVGRSKVFDALVKFWAEGMIFVLAMIVVGYLWLQKINVSAAALFIYLPLTWVIGFGLSALIGWLWPHRRPTIEFPESKQLIIPLSNWKSFPSDHAFSAWLLVFVAYGSGSEIIPLIIFTIIALGISTARVLAGVHYPRDIMAGAVLAGIMSYLFFLV